MSTDTITEGTLTADIMKAIRKMARNTDLGVTLHLGCHTSRDVPVRDENGDWVASPRQSWVTVSATHRLPEGSDPAEFTVRTHLPAMVRTEAYDKQSQVVRDYGEIGGYSIYAGRTQYQFHEGNTLRSLANVGRVGDQLVIQWLLGNNSTNIENASLTHDTCTLAIYRNDTFHAAFPVDDVICPPESFCRYVNTRHIAKYPL